ncbi:unnamed protein product [Closterium sp. Naga37s-1]|nr:unnamed protein product [Closterium sp. Naga37s-1]
MTRRACGMMMNDELEIPSHSVKAKPGAAFSALRALQTLFLQTFKLIPAPPATTMVLSNDIDLLHPPVELEQRKHKMKRLVPTPNSFFMDVKCQGCFNITTVFSHSQTVVLCGSCSTVLCQPTGGKARLTEGCSFRRKGD